MSHHSKHHTKKKGKGFSKITSLRLSRRQKTELEKAYTSIIDELSHSKKEELGKAMAKIQAITRGKQTRKRIPEYKKNAEKRIKKQLKDVEKKLAESIGPKFNKTLKELPPRLLNKILTQITEKYEIEDDEVQNLVVKSILFKKAIEETNETLDMIKEIYGKILDEIIKWINYIHQIRALERGDSSAEEDDEPDDWIIGEIWKIRSVHMTKVGQELYNLQPFLRINTEFHKILLLTSPKNENFKEVDNFYKTQLYKSDSTILSDIEEAATGRQFLELEDKYKDFKKNLPKKIEEIKADMENLIKEKLIFSSNIVALQSIEKIKNAYDNSSKIFEDYTKYQDSKKLSKSKSKSKSRR